MKKLHAITLLKSKIPAFFALAGFLFLLAGASAAQSEYTGEELRQIKERGLSGDMLRYHFPKDDKKAQMSLQSRFAAADGNVDQTFAAAVTEGFGYINEMVVQPDGKIIVVGTFERSNGVNTNSIARFNADGTLDAGFNTGSGTPSVIRTVALQPDGKILIGGLFTTFNGQAVKRIMRLNADGSNDATFSTVPNFNNQVNDIEVLPDGKILVGGQFTLSSSRIVRLNSDGTLDTAFTAANAVVFKIVRLADGKFLVGGDPGASSRAVYRLNADGTLDATFNGAGTGPDSTVWELVVQPDGKILIGGVFQNFNGFATDAIARLNADGSLEAPFEFIPPTGLSYLENSAITLLPDGKILASFYIEDANGNRTRVFRFNANTIFDVTYPVGDAENGLVADFKVLGDGKILVGGGFITYNSQTRLRLVKLNADGTLDAGFSPSVSALASVYKIRKQADGKLLIGGDFDFVNGVRSSGIARLNTDGTLDNTFNVGVGFYGDVLDIAIQTDGKIVAAGNYLAYQNAPAFYISRLNANGTLDANLFSIPENIFFFNLSGVAIQPDGKIVFVGNIRDNSFNLLTALRINANGTHDTTFTPAVIPAPGGNVLTILVQQNGKILIGGTFNFSMNFPRSGIAQLNNNGSLSSGVFGGNSFVYALAEKSDGTIYGGGFQLTKHNADGVPDPNFSTGSGLDNLIRAVAIQSDGKVVIGGFFSTYNGATVNRIARVNADGTLDTGFNAGTGTTGSVLALALQTDGKVVAGGAFYDFSNTEKFSIVRLQNTVSNIRAPFDFDGDGKTDVSIYRQSLGEWWYLRSSNNQNYAAQFGNSTDRIAPADFTGDGKADIAFFRPSSGEWFVLRSEDSSYYSFPFGANGDIPAPGDFDADGKADAAVFRPSDSTWYIRRSSDGGTTIQQFGQTGDVPVVSDYDGDGKADIAIYRVASGEWWIQRSTAGLIAFQFGSSTDKPVQGDYTGDGKSDVAIWRPSSGEWFVLRSENQSYYSFPFGANGDKPTPGDFDGDGRMDAAVFRASDTNWYLQRSTAGFTAVQFGFATDKPVPEAFIP